VYVCVCVEEEEEGGREREREHTRLTWPSMVAAMSAASWSLLSLADAGASLLALCAKTDAPGQRLRRRTRGCTRAQERGKRAGRLGGKVQTERGGQAYDGRGLHRTGAHGVAEDERQSPKGGKRRPGIATWEGQRVPDKIVRRGAGCLLWVQGGSTV